MQTFRTFSNPIEAEILCSRLQDAGIIALVNGGDVARTLSYIGPAVAKVKVEVDPNDFQRATEIVEADERQLVEKSPWVCFGCNEQNEPAFDLCWKCSKARSEDDHQGRLSERVPESPVKPELKAFDEPVTVPTKTQRLEETNNPYQPPPSKEHEKPQAPQLEVTNVEGVEDLDEDQKKHLRRMLIGSVVGLLLIPPVVSLYVLYQLVFKTPYHTKAHPSYRRKILVAHFLALIGIGIGIMLAW